MAETARPLGSLPSVVAVGPGNTRVGRAAVEDPAVVVVATVAREEPAQRGKASMVAMQLWVAARVAVVRVPSDRMRLDQMAVQVALERSRVSLAPIRLMAAVAVAARPAMVLADQGAQAVVEPADRVPLATAFPEQLIRVVAAVALLATRVAAPVQPLLVDRVWLFSDTSEVLWQRVARLHPAREARRVIRSIPLPPQEPMHFRLPLHSWRRSTGRSRALVDLLGTPLLL